MIEYIIPYKFTPKNFDVDIKDQIKINNPEDFLIKLYSNKFNFGCCEVYTTGVYKLLGWAYDLRPYLKKYIVKQYDYIQEYFAPNKTILRKCLRGKIVYIQELQR